MLIGECSDIPSIGGMFTEQVLRNTTDAQSPTHRVRTPAVIYVAPDLGFEVLYA